jgi:hypothetical protein
MEHVTRPLVILLDDEVFPARDIDDLVEPIYSLYTLVVLCGASQRIKLESLKIGISRS